MREMTCMSRVGRTILLLVDSPDRLGQLLRETRSKKERLRLTLLRKKHWCGSTQIASPGGKLSENRLFGTDFLTEEECGR